MMTAIRAVAERKLVIMTTHHAEALEGARMIVHLEAGAIAFRGTLDEYRAYTASRPHLLAAQSTLAPSALSSATQPIGSVSCAAPRSPSHRGTDERDDARTSDARDSHIFYLNALGPPALFGALALSQIAFGAHVLADLSVAHWTDGVLASSTFFLYFGAATAGVVCLHAWRLYSFQSCAMRASIAIHAALLHKTLGAPLALHDRRPAGMRILQAGIRRLALGVHSPLTHFLSFFFLLGRQLHLEVRR